jgi:uncharacterized repeat protein (TIGR03803 family)
MKRTVRELGRLNWGKRAFGVLVLGAATAIALPAQTFTTLFSFDYTDGKGPNPLVQATNGDLYGTTSEGGGSGNGTVFKITPSGTLTTLYSFAVPATDGGGPLAALVQAAHGEFYGTASLGGVNPGSFDYGGGTVFKITPGGTLTTLYSFCSQSECMDGEDPLAGLVQATNGDLYGTTYDGGASIFPCFANVNGCGTVFKITPSGTLTTLHTFAGYPTDGGAPQAGLVQATNGDLYGTTGEGGDSNNGTVFKITPGGTVTTLHSFDGTDGAGPEAGLVQATNGDFYGTTEVGGAYNDGTVFKITPSGALTTLHSFDGTDGANPFAALVQATNGDFYGATYNGGTNGTGGTVFKITPGGTLTTLYSFCSQSACMDGIYPAGLVQDTNGDFYGPTYSGGTNGYGTVFRLSVGLRPFVEIQPASEKVGARVDILGNDLTGAISVSFNGAAATFTVNSSGTAITTTVPAGATTGTIQVVTPSGTLSSNVPFRVLP